jgi:polyisoprenoid-binding protein YceI
MASPTRRRRWLRWLIGSAIALVALVAITVGGVSLYVHQVTAPAMLTLPTVATGSSGAASVNGVWNAGAGSVVGWRAQQVIIGEESPLVGRTEKVWGSITIADGSVTQGSLSADMADLTRTTSKATQNKAFEIGAYPTVTITLTSPIALGSISADGVINRFSAVGSLTIRGETHTVRFTVSTERANDNVYVLADIPFHYTDWHISLGGVGFWADIQNPATIEVLLNLTQGKGNAPSVATSGASYTGGRA